MLGMIKNSLFGNTEETVYKLLSSETKVGEGEEGEVERESCLSSSKRLPHFVALITRSFIALVAPLLHSPLWIKG